MPNLAVVVDAVMAFTALEMAVLWVWHRRTGQGLPVGDYALSLLSGLLLMAALRGVLTPAAGAWPLACLAASGVCHALDLRQRWRRLPQPTRGPGARQAHGGPPAALAVVSPDVSPVVPPTGPPAGPPAGQTDLR